MLQGNRIFKGSFAIVTLIILGCSRDSKDNAVLNFTFPGVPSTQRASATDATILDNSWGLSDPTDISQIGCFAVFVGGPEPEMSNSNCTTSSQTIRFGKFAGLFAKGQTGSIVVPAGSGRRIMIMGFRLSAGASCESVSSQNQDITSANYSNPYIISDQTQNLSPGQVGVDIYPANSFPATNKITNCNFFGSTNNSPPNPFGTGADGDRTISTSPIDVSSDTTIIPGRTFSAARGLTSVGTDGKTLTTDSVFATADFQANDEIMWYIPQTSDTTTPVANMSCGVGTWRGSFSFANVVSASGSTISISYPISQSPAQTNTNLANPTTANSPFCRINIVRVPNFNSLTVSIASGIINTSIPYTNTTGKGGVIVMRVKTNLAINGTPSITVDASGKGFQAVASMQGDGINGSGVASVNGMINGGGAGGPTNGGGGGAGSGNGGGGTTNATSGASAVAECSGVCQVTGPANTTNWGKIFFGGGGGSYSTASSGKGGGIILLFAKYSTIAAGSTLILNSSGLAGGASQGGGGGGGTSYMKTLILAGPSISLSSNGGAGATGTYFGGGGGGGISQIDYCSAANAPTATATGGTSSATAGLNGTVLINANDGNTCNLGP